MVIHHAAVHGCINEEELLCIPHKIVKEGTRTAFQTQTEPDQTSLRDRESSTWYAIDGSQWLNDNENGKVSNK